MQRLRKLETNEERRQRLLRDALLKRQATTENEALIDLMIRRNLEQYGP
jgi:hypothetical protein